MEDTIKQFRFMREQSRDRLGTQEKTKQRMGLASRRIAETSFEMKTSAKNVRDAAQEDTYDPAKSINSWYDEVDALRKERANLEQSTTGALSLEPRPTARYEQEFRGEVTPPADFKDDPEFTSAVSELANKYGIREAEVYAVIQGESGFNPQARNPSGATGLFQFMPSTAEELGVSTEQIMGMSPVEQVKLYDKYLQRWNYSGENRLGIMQAAPAFASKGADEVIYAKGSAAWDQNPGWRELNDGPITVRSINNYYAKRAV